MRRRAVSLDFRGKGLGDESVRRSQSLQELSAWNASEAAHLEMEWDVALQWRSESGGMRLPRQDSSRCISWMDKLLRSTA